MRWDFSAYNEWHQWFAWRPVRVGSVVVWRENIWRRWCESWEYSLEGPGRSIFELDPDEFDKIYG